VVSLLYDPANIRGSSSGLSFLAPSVESLFVLGASGFVPVFQYDRWWTVLSAAWLHGGLLHVFFNMMWVRQLAPITAEVYGSSRLVIIYTVSSIAGFLLSSLAGTALTLGASAPLFGIFGALVWAGRKTGSSELGRQALIYAVVLFVFGLIMPRVDNFAHLGGFLGGLACAAYLNPLQRETFGNLLLALAFVALTAVSLLLSFVTA
jgi:rhomboid protease GluP